MAHYPYAIDNIAIPYVRTPCMSGQLETVHNDCPLRCINKEILK